INFFISKRKFSFSILFAISFCHFTFAQNKQIDSLVGVLKNSKEDSGKVNALNLIGRQFYLVNSYDSALSCARRAQQLGEKLNYKKGIANAYRGIGNVYTD